MTSSIPVKRTERIYSEEGLALECLNTNWFMSVRHAREIIESWRRDYNEVRPHSSPKGKTPKEFADTLVGLSSPVVLIPG